MEQTVKVNKDKLRDVRGDLSQTDFAKLMDVTQGFIGHLEKGIKQPSISLLYKYARRAKKPIEYFLEKEHVQSQN
jgi:transcriptional regulator with XRE-family HTH domain